VKQAGSGIGVEGKAKSIKTISTLYDSLVATTEFGNVMLGDVAQQSAAGQEEIYSYKVTFSYFPGGVRPQAAQAAPAAAAPRPKPKKAAADSME
jgi:hypothetical protein